MRIRKVEEKALFVTRAVSLTVVVLVLVTLCVFAYAASAAQISVEPECQVVTKDETFTVNITVYPEESEVFAASYTLHFNNTLLNATSQVNGSFLSQDGAETFEVKNETNNILGEVKYGECRKDVDHGVTNPGVLATIAFKAIADGSCELRLSDLDGVILADPNYTSIPTNVTNGSVRVGLCGDVNCDKTVDMIDVLDTYDYFMYNVGQLHEWAADVDKSKVIDMIDVLDIYDCFMHGKSLNCWC